MSVEVIIDKQLTLDYLNVWGCKQITEGGFFIEAEGPPLSNFMAPQTESECSIESRARDIHRRCDLYDRRSDINILNDD